MFEDDEDKTHTKLLGNVLDKIERFEACLGGIVREWELFWSTDGFHFTTYGKPDWPRLISTIASNISELTRLRDLFHQKRARFESKLRNVRL